MLLPRGQTSPLLQQSWDATKNIVSSDKGEEGQIYLGWARFERYNNVAELSHFFDERAQEPQKAVRLLAFDPGEALAEARRELELVAATWKRRPKHHRSEDGWFHLQKTGGGGEVDVFIPRPEGPCNHESWFPAEGKAPQARAGARHFFGEMPDHVEGCNKCHCYRARFDRPVEMP